MISPADKERIRAANVANIIRKVKDGKTITPAEMALIEESPEAAEVPGKKPARRVSVHSLHLETGTSERVIRKRLVDGGCYPPHKHPMSKVMAAIKPPTGDKEGDSIKERKTFEEWRKLKLANDVKEGVLIPRSLVAETVRRLAAKFGELLTAKLEQEYPATVAGLDVPSARIYGKKLNDQIRAEVQGWAGGWNAR